MAKKFTRYAQSKKFRVIVDGISFYSTAKQIRNGVGDTYSVNAATQKALLVLENMKSGGPAVGLCGTWDNRAVQLDEL